MKSPSKRRRRKQTSPKFSGPNTDHDQHQSRSYTNNNPYSILDYAYRGHHAFKSIQPRSRHYGYSTIRGAQYSQRNQHIGDISHDPTEGFTLIRHRRSKNPRTQPPKYNARLPYTQHNIQPQRIDRRTSRNRTHSIFMIKNKRKRM